MSQAGSKQAGIILTFGYVMIGLAAFFLVSGTLPTRYGGPDEWVDSTEEPALFAGAVLALLVFGLPCVITGHLLQIRDKLRRGALTEAEQFDKNIRWKFISISIGFVLLQLVGGLVIYRAGDFRDWSSDAFGLVFYFLLIFNTVVIMVFHNLRPMIWKRPRHLPPVESNDES